MKVFQIVKDSEFELGGADFESQERLFQVNHYKSKQKQTKQNLVLIVSS